jgi:hypothetical protein
MNRLIIIALLGAGFSGCSKQDGQLNMAAAGGARSGAITEKAAPGTTPAARRTLSYRHTLELGVSEDKVAQAYAAGQAACRALTTNQRAILHAQVRGPSGSRSPAAARAPHRPS